MGEGSDGCSGLLRDFELHRALCLLLEDDRALGNMFAVCDVAHSQLDQISGSEFAIDRQIEQGQGADIARELNANPNGPDVPKSERCFLSDEFTLVPWFTMRNGCFRSVHERLLH